MKTRDWIAIAIILSAICSGLLGLALGMSSPPPGGQPVIVPLLVLWGPIGFVCGVLVAVLGKRK